MTTAMRMNRVSRPHLNSRKIFAAPLDVEVELPIAAVCATPVNACCESIGFATVHPPMTTLRLSEVSLKEGDGLRKCCACRQIEYIGSWLLRGLHTSKPRVAQPRVRRRLHPRGNAIPGAIQVAAQI